jgi:hypothetical protein
VRGSGLELLPFDPMQSNLSPNCAVAQFAKPPTPLRSALPAPGKRNGAPFAAILLINVASRRGFTACAGVEINKDCTCERKQSCVDETGIGADG